MSVYGAPLMLGGTHTDGLWENPNPTSSLSSSVTISGDYTGYDQIFVLIAYVANGAQRWVEIVPGDTWTGVHSPTQNYATYRNMTFTSSGITFGTTAGYIYHDGGKAAGTNFAVPIKVVGVIGEIGG